MDTKWFYSAMIVLIVVVGGGLVADGIVEKIVTAQPALLDCEDLTPVPVLIGNKANDQVIGLLLVSPEDAELLRTTEGTWRLLAERHYDDAR